ncbi:MAG: ComF family protein [Geobacteraceae bacterium]|nr:ComF family protein [Geobacteraceae bacterium]
MLVRAFLDIIFPPLCHGCRAHVPGKGEIPLCAGCWDRIAPIASPLCPVCGAPFITEHGNDHPCGPCLTERPPFAGARSAVEFHGMVQELVHRFKYGGKMYLARTLGLLAARALSGFARDTAPECIIPVPLHTRRLRERGFNQSQLLGRILAERWSLPLSVNNLRRARWTEPQVGLSVSDRERNVRGAFTVAHPERIREKRVLLVDDVYTTGSTVAECARTLARAGAKEVSVVTVARAVP